MIIYRQSTVHDPAYELEKKLRNRVLRLPLNVQLSAQDIQDEDQQIHLLAVDAPGAVIGCVLVAFSGERAKIRQMAVEPAYQRQGIGTELIQRAEQIIRERNVRQVTLHARLSACTFYERLGYIKVSGVFNEVTIPHVEMEKALGIMYG